MSCNKKLGHKNVREVAKTQVKLRDAVVGDIPAINDIYNHYVSTSTCTWQLETDTNEARLAWLAAHGEKHPAIVAEFGDEIVGWGSLSPFFCRTSMVEDSVYVRDGFLGRGIGASLLFDLIARARALRYHSIVALISADQTPSIALHAKFGFVESGRLREAGCKFGRWLDMVLMQRMLD